MQKKAQVSIVVPLYNRRSLIGATIQSVIAQTYALWELVIVDDGSTDGSYELVNELAADEPRIRLLRRERNPPGAPACRNIGAEQATGKYLIFLDSDDLLAPFCLERRVAAFDVNKGFDFMVFPMLLFHEQPGDADTLWNIQTQEDDLNRFLRIDGVWQTTGPIYKKDAFLTKLKGFAESLPFWQDFELHTRALIHGLPYEKCYQYPPDCYLRRHASDSISQAGLHTVAHSIQKIGIYQNLINLAIAQQIPVRHIQRSAVTTLLHFARVCLVEHRAAEQAFGIWHFAYQKSLISKALYILGNFHLKYKYLHLQTRKGCTIKCLLGKFFSLILDTKYPPKRSTLCKVKMEHVYA